LYSQFMRRLLPLFCLTFFLAAPRAGAQEALRAWNTEAFELAAPASKTDILEACPKFQAFTQDAAYLDDSSNLKEVSEVPSGVLPPPADDLDRAGLLAALKNNLIYWQNKPDTFKIALGGDSYTAARMRYTTQTLLDLLSAAMTQEELREALKTRFKVYRSAADDGSAPLNNSFAGSRPSEAPGASAGAKEDGSGKVVITGYYEAEIKAARKPDAVNRFPIYLKPSDLIKTAPGMGVDFDYGRINENGNLIPYYSRSEISGGVLAGKNLELVWTEHPSRIMLLQIQGSGILRFPDGNSIKAGFDGANGRPFKSVQKLLMDCGEVPAMSFKDFISYLSLQGERESRLVDLNPRYVFFKPRPNDTPAYGAMGAGLTPGRSIAVDPEPIPLGVTALLSSKRPVAGADGALSFKEFTRFVAAQDTGSAIRGPGRIDLFWGSGGTAETEASSMKAPGTLYILIAK